jgi:hypothetical protein
MADTDLALLSQPEEKPQSNELRVLFRERPVQSA